MLEMQCSQFIISQLRYNIMCRHETNQEESKTQEFVLFCRSGHCNCDPAPPAILCADCRFLLLDQVITHSATHHTVLFYFFFNATHHC